MEYSSLSTDYSTLQTYVYNILDVARGKIDSLTTAQATALMDFKIANAKSALGTDINEFYTLSDYRIASTSTATARYVKYTDISNASGFKTCLNYLTINKIYEDRAEDDSQPVFQENFEGWKPSTADKWYKKYKKEFDKVVKHATLTADVTYTTEITYKPFMVYRV